jgi:hypothetical protein
MRLIPPAYVVPAKSPEQQAAPSMLAVFGIDIKNAMKGLPSGMFALA